VTADTGRTVSGCRSGRERSQKRWDSILLPKRSRSSDGRRAREGTSSRRRTTVGDRLGERRTGRMNCVAEEVGRIGREESRLETAAAAVD
jgi:hypothetical protein